MLGNRRHGRATLGARVTTGQAGWRRPRSSKPVEACPARHSGRFDSDASLAPMRLWTITGCCTKAGYALTKFFAHISQTGPIRYVQVPCSIGVLEALDTFMPIGEASCRNYDANELAVWTLRIGKQEIPGLWIIVDREFTPAQ